MMTYKNDISGKTNSLGANEYGSITGNSQFFAHRGDGVVIGIQTTDDYIQLEYYEPRTDNPTTDDDFKRTPNHYQITAEHYDGGDVSIEDLSLSEAVRREEEYGGFIELSDLAEALRVADGFAKKTALTRPHAETFALRDAGFSRNEMASILWKSMSTVDTQLKTARDKIQQAEETISLIEGSEPSLDEEVDA